jgi:hypothetical protein
MEFIRSAREAEASQPRFLGLDRMDNLANTHIHPAAPGLPGCAGHLPVDPF